MSVRQPRRQHRATDRLAHAVPASQTLLARAAERGANLGAITSALIRLLDRNSAADLQAAILEALERNVHNPPDRGSRKNAVRQIGELVFSCLSVIGTSTLLMACAMKRCSVRP